MTHDELLKELQNWLCSDQKASLRKVIELHAPQEITLPDGSWGVNCFECEGWVYPCLTIETIKAGVKAK